MPSYGTTTAAFQGYVDVALHALPYLIPSDASITYGPGLSFVSDQPIASSGVALGNGGLGGNTQVAGTQVWFLGPTGYTTLAVGATVTESNVLFPWGGYGTWSQWGSVNGGNWETSTGGDIYAFVGAFGAGSLAATNMSFIAEPGGEWDIHTNNASPIRWMGTDYLIINMDDTIAGRVILGGADGTLSVATVWPGLDATKSTHNPPCYPDKGGGFNYFLQDGLPSGSGGPSLVAVSSSNASTATYNHVTLSDTGHNALFAGAVLSLPMIGPQGWSVWVSGGLILIAPDFSKYWFYRFSGADDASTTIIGDNTTFQWTSGAFIQADGTVWFNRVDTGSPTQFLVSAALPSFSASDVFFSPTAAFFDLSVTTNRRKFLSASGGARPLGSDGSAVLGVSPSVFLHVSGGGLSTTADTFAANSGTGGAFVITDPHLQLSASNPPGTQSTGQGGPNIVGDYRNGNIYSLNLDQPTDNGTQRRWLRRWRALAQPDPNPHRFVRLTIQMEAGAQVPDGTAPLIELRWSDDGGHNWSNRMIAKAGPPGATAQRVFFTPLGSTRRDTGLDRIFELSSSDPCKIAIISAELEP